MAESVVSKKGASRFNGILRRPSCRYQYVLFTYPSVSKFLYMHMREACPVLNNLLSRSCNFSYLQKAFLGCLDVGMLLFYNF
jgi:hypothetical protein